MRSLAFLPLCLLLLAPSAAFASHGVALVSMSQRNPSNNAVIASGGNVPGTQIGFQVSSDSPTCGSSYAHRVQFEVIPTTSSFTGSPTFSSPWYSGFKPDCVVKAFPRQDYTIPSNGSNWKWRVRELTSSNGGSSVSSTGPWTDFGSATDVDFTSNFLPVAEANGPYTGGQGAAIALTAAGSSDSDGSISLYEWDCTDDGSYDTSSTSPTGSTCTYPDDGSYTVRLRVTDNEGAQATDTASVTVTNAPPVAEANGPYTGTRGFPIPISATGSGDADGALVSFQWDCTTDGSYEISASAPVGNACQYAAVGTYTITLLVTDDDGATATDTASVVVGNDPPTADAGGPYSGAEGSPIPLDGSASSDVGGGSIVQYAWDCTNDGSFDVIGNSATGNACTYTDDGAFTLRLQVTDDDGATATDTSAVTIANVAPVLTSNTVSGVQDEGSSLQFGATATDAGSADVPGLVFTWSWGDGSPDETGASLTHAYDDEGSYTVTVTVDDGDGGTDVGSQVVLIANVAPEITSTAPATASEGVLWSYAPTATEPGADTLVWTLSPSAPASLTFDSATGAMEWTPSYADSLLSPRSWTVTVSDGDGGTDAQSITVTIVYADDDADGLPDGWELANGLDPSDPNDAAADPDADGLSNLDEYDGGTDPQVYDGPEAPVLSAPIAGEESSSESPDLFWLNAFDPQGDVLTYEVEVYADPALTTLVTSATALSEDVGGTTSWKVDLVLTENTSYTWRARASDPYVAGPWSAEESFFVNVTNDAPEAPALTSPILGEVAASVTPLLLWSEATDLDLDLLTYDVEVLDALGGVVASVADIAGDGLVGQWMVDVELSEDAVYTWTARAVDEHGLAGPWADEEAFLVSTSNAAPFGTVFVSPDDGAEVSSTPSLVASESTDPEGGALQYHFEIDAVASFDSASYQEGFVDGTGTGEVQWNLLADGITLPENAISYARVRAVDDGGVTSTPDTISFFVRGGNDAPSVPVLVSPADGAEGGASPELQAERPVDPEGDLVFVDFVIARDPELTDVVAEVQDLLVTSELVGWTPPVNLQGELWWSARALDELGAASAWATPFRYVAPSVATGDDDDDDDGAPAACDCGSDLSAGSPASWALMLALAPVVLLRRRRS